MMAIRWLVMFVFVSVWKEKEAVCNYGSPQRTPQDLFACEFGPYGANISTPWNEVVTVAVDELRTYTVPHTIAFSSPSPQAQPYLEVKLKYFYDVCAVAMWTNGSNLTETNFTIQTRSLSLGYFWQRYREKGQVKNFQGIQSNSEVSLHRVRLTAMRIRFTPLRWNKGSYFHFAIHGSIASCESSQRRMDLWCRNQVLHVNASASGCSGELRARFDRGKKWSWKMWRCYYESALTSDLKAYNNNLKSLCYETKNQLIQVSRRCSNISEMKNCTPPGVKENKTEGSVNTSELIDQPTENGNKTEEKVTRNKTEERVRTPELIDKPTKKEDKPQGNVKTKELIDRVAEAHKNNQRSPRYVLEVLSLLENVLRKEPLKNTTQQFRDHFAKVFLETSSSLLNETNVPTWKTMPSNSTTVIRLLKVVEDFGAIFANYLECNNNTENGRIFSFNDIEYTAKSCVARNTFPLKLISNQACNLGNHSTDACNASSDVEDSVIIPRPLTQGHQRWQVSFISYKNAHRLFPAQETEGNSQLRVVKVESRIVSLSAKPDGLVSKESPVVVVFKPLAQRPQNEKDLHCGFWNFNIGGDAHGAWSTDGCSLLSINTSQVTCQCSHLTNFALLLQITSESETLDIHRETLQWMTYVGCSLSLAAEILCLLAFVLLTKPKGTKVKIHINLVMCLAVGHLVFLTGVERAAGRRMACTIVAVTLHYFFLASFMWMLVEGVYLVSKVKNVFQPMNNLRKAFVMAYGIPVVIVGGTFAGKLEEYGSLRHCWLSVSYGTIWSFVGPVCFTILANLIMLVFVLYRLTKTRAFSNKSELEKIRLTVRASLVMLPLLGLSWFFGLLAVNEDTIVFQYIFVGLNSLQGVFLFAFQCVVHEEVKTGIRNTLRRRRVTQQLTREVSVARADELTPRGHNERKLSSKEAVLLPGITIFNHHTKVVQSLQLTKVIQRSQDTNENGGDHSSTIRTDKVSVKFAWEKRLIKPESDKPH